MSSPRTSFLGGAFLLLALFAGVLGGALALPVFRLHPSPGMVVSHAVLMTFFVICPAILGGLSQWYLPRALGCDRMMLSSFSIAGWVMLVAGVFLLPLAPVAGLVCWGLGTLAIAWDVIVTILEGRQVAFRNMAPLAWALLATAIALVVVNPVMLALLAKGKGALEVVQLLHVPEMSLMLVPSLGLIVQSLWPEYSARSSIVARVAPYAFGVMGLLPPLLWADMLFGGLPMQAVTVAVWAGQILPGLVVLAGLCVDSWSHSVREWSVSLWSLGAVLLLLMGWCGLLLPHETAWFMSRMGGHAATGYEFGHKIAVFGSLMALAGAFYRWFLHEMTVRGTWYDRLGTLHAVLTFIGIVGAMLPFAGAFTSTLLSVSVLGFSVMGAWTWRHFVQRYVQDVTMSVSQRS